MEINYANLDCVKKKSFLSLLNENLAKRECFPEIIEISLTSCKGSSRVLCKSRQDIARVIFVTAATAVGRDRNVLIIGSKRVSDPGDVTLR